MGKYTGEPTNEGQVCEYIGYMDKNSYFIFVLYLLIVVKDGYKKNGKPSFTGPICQIGDFSIIVPTILF